MYEMAAPVKGIILNGGMSTRMGRDKSSLKYHSKIQKDYLYDLLSCYCHQTYVSVKSTEKKLFLPVLRDKFLFGGPLNGILTALNSFPGFAILSVPCDMPQINTRLIKLLLKNRNRDSVATCFIHHDEIEPLFTLWEPSAGKALMEYIKNKNHSPKAFLEIASVNYINSPFIMQNLNTPEERENYLK